MKVLICDYAGNSAQWIDEFIIKENFEVVGTITPATDKKLLIENSSWEYLLIFEQRNRNFFVSLMQFMNIPPQRVIYALDWESWAEHPLALYTLINPKGSGQLAYRTFSFHTAKDLNYFMSCTTANGLHYLATSRDVVIMKKMYTSREVWAENEMKLFHLLAKIFYGIDGSEEGLFLDLGANIGTTGIYFTKMLAPNLKLLAFEPDPENFKLLRTNLILNNAEEKAVIENYGLGEENSEMTMFRDPLNPGANGLFKLNSEQETETVKIIPLDKYFAEKNLSPKDVKYIWIDTEGFEAQVLLGAKNILTENPAPIFMEFNPRMWQQSGYLYKMIELLSNFYEGYVWVRAVMETKKIEVLPMEKLLEFKDLPYSIGGLGDIFLVHELKEVAK